MSLAILSAFHVPLFQGAASFLAVDDPLRSRTAVVLLEGVDGETGYDEVAAMYRQGLAQQVLILQGPPNRTVQMQIVPSGSDIAFREFMDREVSSDDIFLVLAQNESDWSTARALGHWLDEHPDATVTVMCNDFSGRTWRHICGDAMDESCTDRLFWHTLPDRRFNESNWWRNKFGVLAFCGQYVRLVNAWFSGEPDEPERLDPSEYEQMVEKKLHREEGFR